MSNPYELNSNDRTNFSNEKDIAHRQDKIHRLSDHLSEGEASPSAGEARRPESKVRPASDRSSNARLEAEAPSHLGFAKSKTSLRRPLLFAMLPVALIVGAYFYIRGGSVMTTDNAYVQSDMVSVSTDVSGIVSEVLVHDNQHVSAGDVLFKLDDLQYRLALGRANAQLANVKNDLMVLQANYRNMEAQIEQAKTDIDFFNTTFKRQQKLAATNVASQATFDDAFHNLQSGQQKLISLNQQLAGIAASLNTTPDAPIEEHPRYKDALAARDEAKRQFDHATVRAPFEGIVTNVPSLQPGQYLAAASTAFNIISTDHVWVQASPKETELTYVKAGQRATIDVDAYPGQQWIGVVESISPASASSFSLLPAENSNGNWVKVVQRIPIRVRIDNSDDKPPLRVGMSVVLRVDTGHERGLPTFLTGLL